MGYYDVDKLGELYPPAPSTHTPAQPGYGSVPEYLVSALPYVTASTLTSATTYEYRMPNVTRFITVANQASPGTAVRLGFTKNGVEGGNYIQIDGGQTVTLELRVSVFYLRPNAGLTVSLCAGLTAIPSKYAPVLTGSVSGTNGSWQGVG